MAFISSRRRVLSKQEYGDLRRKTEWTKCWKELSCYNHCLNEKIQRYKIIINAQFFIIE